MQNPSDIEAADVQVLFADLQPQIVACSKTVPPESLEQSVVVLVQLARIFDLPITLSVVPEGDAPPTLLPAVAKETIGVPQFVRASASPLFDAPTYAAIKSHNRRTLFIAGFATEVVVLHAAVAALKEGRIPRLYPRRCLRRNVRPNRSGGAPPNRSSRRCNNCNSITRYGSFARLHNRHREANVPNPSKTPPSMNGGRSSITSGTRRVSTTALQIVLL